ncbi:porin [Duganella sp. FT50W]|uniref:Porin n=1 Tax=Duganella lactea TaxID=2692173 RepID=A0A6L8MR95_9BURK|nr:porin [Duganella lactea]MYM84559.1 porin [Duganella lactea]
MKRKKYISGVALASGFMLGQGAAAQSNVTLYGIADLGARYSSGLSAANAPTSNTSTGITSGVNNTSRWGFKGEESLGNDMAAVFHLEGGLNLDTGSSAKSDKLFDRIAYVGLKTSAGRLTAGRQATILSDAINPVDPLGMRNASFNPNINVTALSNTAFGTHAFGTQYGTSGYNDNFYRLDNMLKFTSEMGPVTARVSYSFGEVPGDSSALSTTGAALSYQRDGFVVSGGYMKFKNRADFALDAYTLGAAYKLGEVTLKANYGNNKADTAINKETKQRIASGGGSVLVSPGNLLTIAYYRVRRDSTGFSQDGFDRLYAYLEHDLSKRTTLYVEADSTKWNGNAAGVTGTLANSTHGRGVTLGMMHKF